MSIISYVYTLYICNLIYGGQNMRFDGIQSAGHKFDYNPGTIKRKPEEDDPIRKVFHAGANLVNNLGNILAGNMNPQASDNKSGSSTAYRQ